MANKNDLFKLVDVHYRVDEGPAPLSILKGVNLTIKEGSSIAITGVSGSGKSTLLNLMALMLNPTQGEILYKGHRVDKLNEDERANWRMQHASFIFQSFELLDNLTALENIEFPMELRKETNTRQKALKHLNDVGLSERANHFPTTLSGGEKQRVAIARAFSLNPSLLFADEPTGNLDKNTGRRVADLMFDFNQGQSTLVMVTHSLELAKRADIVYHLENGQLDEV